MVIWFKYAVILSAVVCISLLTYLIIKTFSFGKNKLNSSPSGDWRKGVFFAFGRGMVPWEKDSAKKHLLTYGAGIIYHTGIFAAFLYLFLVLFSVEAVPFLKNILVVLTASAFICGIGLLLKRIVYKYMRTLSTPDDFISNILVDIFLLVSFFHALGLPVQILFYSSAILIFIYIPLGKIRHCFFFFYSRILFGSFFGRRGIYPRRRISSYE